MIDSRKKLQRRRRRDLVKCHKATFDHKVILFRSNRYMYASIVHNGRVLTQISNLSPQTPETLKGKNNTAVCEWIGGQLTDKLKHMGVAKVLFSKSVYKFHGRVKRLIEVVREGGVQC